MSCGVSLRVAQGNRKLGLVEFHFNVVVGEHAPLDVACRLMGQGWRGVMLQLDALQIPI